MNTFTPLFRGWSPERKDWVEGFLANGMFGEDWDVSYIFDRNRIWNRVIPESVGLFFGLHDKHGEKIFGPVGSLGGQFIGDKGAFIVWSQRLACWCFNFKDADSETPLFYDDVSKYEIHSNCYQP